MLLAIGQALPSAAQPAKDVQALLAKAQTQGSVRVIVGVRAAFQAEGRLDVRAAQAQRLAITQSFRRVPFVSRLGRVIGEFGGVCVTVAVAVGERVGVALGIGVAVGGLTMKVGATAVLIGGTVGVAGSGTCGAGQPVNPKMEIVPSIRHKRTVLT